MNKNKPKRRLVTICRDAIQETTNGATEYVSIGKEYIVERKWDPFCCDWKVEKTRKMSELTQKDMEEAYQKLRDAHPTDTELKWDPKIEADVRDGLRDTNFVKTLGIKIDELNGDQLSNVMWAFIDYHNEED